MVKELTQSQLDRLDAVDNAIQQLLEELSGKKLGWIDWDTEVIGVIRDALQEVICGKMKLMEPMDFYPFMEDGKGEPTPGPIWKCDDCGEVFSHFSRSLCNHIKDIGHTVCPYNVKTGEKLASSLSEARKKGLLSLIKTPPEPKGKVYIDVDGGNITGVYGLKGLECLIIDEDNGDVDDDVRAENERKSAEEEAAIDSGEIVELY